MVNTSHSSKHKKTYAPIRYDEFWADKYYDDDEEVELIEYTRIWETYEQVPSECKFADIIYETGLIGGQKYRWGLYWDDYQVVIKSFTESDRLYTCENAIIRSILISFFHTRDIVSFGPEDYQDWIASDMPICKFYIKQDIAYARLYMEGIRTLYN